MPPIQSGHPGLRCRSAVRAVLACVWSTMVLGAAEAHHTVAQLVTSAQASHPTAAAIAATRLAAAAQVQQAGAWANPTIELTGGRSRLTAGGDDHPYGGTISQRLEWLGTRNARTEAARARLDASEWEAAVARLSLEAEVRRAAIAHACAREAVEAAAASLTLAEEVATVATTRQQAGEMDRADRTRATVEVTLATIERNARRHAASTALAVLRTWCDPALPEDTLISDALPATAAAMPTLSGEHPQLAALQALARSAEAESARERSARVPEVTVGVFADRETDKDTYGLKLGFEVPLWHQNQAGIERADAEQAKARAALRLERLRLARDLAEALGTAHSAYDEITALSATALPGAEEVVRLRTAAYRAGSAPLSEVMEARRTVIAVRAGLREARRRAALAAVDLGLAAGVFPR